MASEMRTRKLLNEERNDDKNAGKEFIDKEVCFYVAMNTIVLIDIMTLSISLP